VTASRETTAFFEKENHQNKCCVIVMLNRAGPAGQRPSPASQSGYRQFKRTMEKVGTGIGEVAAEPTAGLRGGCG